MRIISGTLVVAGLVLATAVAGSVSAADKVTICHAAGQDGTLKFITLTLSWNAAFGNAGHFYENGTPRAGHENDYLGECQGAEPSVTPPISPSPTPPAEPSTSPSMEPSSPPASASPQASTPPSPEPSVTPPPASTPTPSPTAPPSPIPTFSPEPSTPTPTLPPTDTEA